LATGSSFRSSPGATFKVILDTNFLLVPFQFKIDIKEEIKKMVNGEYELCVTEGVLRELEDISKEGSSSKRGRQSRCALSLVKEMRVLKTDVKDVDDALVSLASDNNVVCTNDKVLKEKIRKKGAPVIFMRQKGYLAVDGYIK